MLKFSKKKNSPEIFFQKENKESDGIFGSQKCVEMEPQN